MESPRRSPRKRSTRGRNDLRKDKGSEDKRGHIPEKTKRPRKPSATPQPETETRLRPSIKGTPNSQHLTNTPEHRRSLFGKTQANIFAVKTPSPSGSPAWQGFSSGEGASREPSLPGPTAHKASPTPDASMFRPPGNVAPQVMFHPTYGWGWVMQQPVPPSPQEATDTHDRIANLEPPLSQKLPLSKELPASPLIQLPTMHDPRSPASVVLEGSALGSPFQPEVRTQFNKRDAVPTVRSSTPQESNVEIIPQAMAYESQLSSATGSSSMVSGSSSYFRSVEEGDVPLLAAQDEQNKATSSFARLNQEEGKRPLAPHYERVVNFFDLYRQYFDSNFTEEIKRLPEDTQPKNGSDMSDDVIKAAFDLFRKQTTEYESFLLDWEHIRQIASGCQDPDTRHSRFRLFAEKIKRIVRWASAFSGFETIVCTVGREIHTDQALSEAVCSDMVVDFFQARLQISETDLAGHLKAHAYDHVSRRTLPTVPGVSSSRNALLSDWSSSSRVATPQPIHALEVAPPAPDQGASGVCLSDGASASGEDPSVPIEDLSAPLEVSSVFSAVASVPTAPIKAETSPDAPSIPTINTKGRKKTADGDPRLEELKKRLRKMTEHCGVPQLLKGKTQFTSLPKILALNGWVLENWPEDLPYPCDCKTGKGVAGLSVQYQESLLEAFTDPNFPLRVVKKSDHAIPSTEPAIIGVPPPPNSAFTHGRRRYLDKEDREDRGGPPRLNSTVLQPVPSSIMPEPRSEVAAINTDEMNHRKRPSEHQESDSMCEGPVKKVRFEDERVRPQQISGSGDVSMESESEDGQPESETESTSSEQDSGDSLETERKPKTEAVPQAMSANRRRALGQMDEGKVFNEQLARARPQSQRRGGGMPHNCPIPDIIVDGDSADSNDMARYANARPGSYWLPMQQSGQYAFNLPPGTQLMPMNACGPSSPDPSSGMPCMPVPSHFLPYAVPQSSVALQHNVKHLQAPPHMSLAPPIAGQYLGTEEGAHGQQRYNVRSHHAAHSATQPTPRRT